jgi:putative ATPase
MQAATDAVRSGGALPVPAHLRNAPNALARARGHAVGYEYPHDTPDGIGTQSHLPTELAHARFYHPTDRGWEGSRRDYLVRARERRSR